MSKVKYSDAPADIEAAMDEAVRVDPYDVFPPEFFVERSAKEKITLNVSSRAVDAFRAYAKEHGMKYQVLMNDVLSSYAETRLQTK